MGDDGGASMPPVPEALEISNSPPQLGDGSVVVCVFVWSDGVMVVR